MQAMWAANKSRGTETRGLEREREREKYNKREVSRKRMRSRKLVTDGESVTVKRNKDVK